MITAREPGMTDQESSSRPRTAEDMPLPGGDFRLFITRLSVQAMMGLGMIENPITGKAQKNLSGARMVIDDLMMLRDKTVGNLDGGEAAHLSKLVSDLEHAWGKADAAESSDT
ncbi:MAG: hypothetical protein ACI835_001462 [Planctomycetota bacterium]|jgi:hypothetical protein